jgi:hypothetical protein
MPSYIPSDLMHKGMALSRADGMGNATLAMVWAGMEDESRRVATTQSPQHFRHNTFATTQSPHLPTTSPPRHIGDQARYHAPRTSSSRLLSWLHRARHRALSPIAPFIAALEIAPFRPDGPSCGSETSPR